MLFARPIARFFQTMSSIIVLGLSITLARLQHYGHVPSETGYAIFAGAIGTLASVTGTASVYIDSLRHVVTWVLDGVSCVALLIAGIVYAVALRGTNCNDTSTDGSTWDNKLISGGCYYDKSGTKWCHDKDKVHARCVAAQTDAAFMFIGFLGCLGALVVSFLLRRK
ncbi:uncharacterized protein N7459_006177 [Penicillium hispanicum]|uniref:uncharacterized protein n=1 Tax=Penicillium hispanicum TaxID=1080232 RepID=UPI002540CE5B|nr:uncharacterized protein N7459_006177 [Penicillium hispanicum]KAJ5580192.1 hypothetical protein N7459_006177 [Penicillium hispanicum]